MSKKSGCCNAEINYGLGRIGDLIRCDKCGLVCTEVETNHQKNHQKLDRPLSFRVPHKTHKQYKSLSGFERKEITYKLIKSLQRMVRERLKNE